MVLWRTVLRELVDYGPRPGACGVGVCARLPLTLGDPGETFGPRIDRIPRARPPWPLGASSPRIKKLIFSAPSTCPIDLLGPSANRTALERLHDAFYYTLVCLCLSWGRRSRGAFERVEQHNWRCRHALVLLLFVRFITTSCVYRCTSALCSTSLC